MMAKLVTILSLAFLQNASFTIVSRSRNRSSFAYRNLETVTPVVGMLLDKDPNGTEG